MIVVCPNCHKRHTAKNDLMNTRVRCKGCKQRFVVDGSAVGVDSADDYQDATDMTFEAVIEANNPFGKAIQSVIGQLKTMRWTPPFIHNFVAVVVFLFVITLLVLLYPTIGLCVHLTGIFYCLISDTIVEMRAKPPVDRIGQTVAIGIYAVFFVLFGAISLPFYVLGSAAGAFVDYGERNRTVANTPMPLLASFAILIVVITVVAAVVFRSDSVLTF